MSPRPLSDSLVLLSIRSEFASLIRKGQKRAEFRKRFSPRLASFPIILYETAPAQRFSLWVTLQEIVCDAPTRLWNRFGHLNGTDRQPFDRYFDGAKIGSAILLDHVQSFDKPLSLQEARQTCHNYRPPQSYTILKDDHPLHEVIVNRPRSNPEEVSCLPVS